jgi:hypothetical protein
MESYRRSFLYHALLYRGFEHFPLQDYMCFMSDKFVRIVFIYTGETYVF